MKILMQAISNVHAGCRFPTPVVNGAIYLIATYSLTMSAARV